MSGTLSKDRRPILMFEWSWAGYSEIKYFKVYTLGERVYDLLEDYNCLDEQLDDGFLFVEEITNEPIQLAYSFKIISGHNSTITEIEPVSIAGISRILQEEMKKKNISIANYEDIMYSIMEEYNDSCESYTFIM